MRCEFPTLTRCCFCFPLRLGLLVWAYIKTISTAVLFSMFLFGAIFECVRRGRCSGRHYVPALLIYIPIFSTLAIDIIFHIIFIISAHKKEHRKMRLFYRYSIFNVVLYLLGLTIIVTLFFVDYHFYRAYFFGYFYVALFMWTILIQIYVIILVRSEFVKLKRNSNFQFVNHVAEPNVVNIADLQSVEEMQYQYNKQ